MACFLYNERHHLLSIRFTRRNHYIISRHTVVVSLHGEQQCRIIRMCTARALCDARLYIEQRGTAVGEAMEFLV